MQLKSNFIKLTKLTVFGFQNAKGSTMRRTFWGPD